jgi:hypothetical protein
MDASGVSDAAADGANSVMTYLAQRGVSVNGEILDMYTCLRRPINVAAHYGHKHTVTWLLEKGALLDDSLCEAVASGSRSTVQLLIDHGAMKDHGVVQRARK